jgi:hypothetical protein
METTFDLRNGKHSIRKVISFDGTFIRIFLKPLFGIYDKYKVGIELKREKRKIQRKLDISTISIM